MQGGGAPLPPGAYGGYGQPGSGYVPIPYGAGSGPVSYVPVPGTGASPALAPIIYANQPGSAQASTPMRGTAVSPIVKVVVTADLDKKTIQVQDSRYEPINSAINDGDYSDNDSGYSDAESDAGTEDDEPSDNVAAVRQAIVSSHFAYHPRSAHAFAAGENHTNSDSMLRDMANALFGY